MRATRLKERERSKNREKEGGVRFKEKLGKSWESDYGSGYAADWLAVRAAVRRREPNRQSDNPATEEEVVDGGAEAASKVVENQFRCHVGIPYHFPVQGE